MGQYWMPVNLDKKEYIHPHKLGSGLKLWEQLASDGVGQALIILTAAQRERRGGGDLDMEENWHGPERNFPEHDCSPGPMPENYPSIAARTIGRWAGDRIAIVGDYAEDSDLPTRFKASLIFGKTHRSEDGPIRKGQYRDITDDVCRVIEHELQGKFYGDGSRRFYTVDKLEAAIAELRDAMRGKPRDSYQVGKLLKLQGYLAELQGAK